MFTLFTFTSNRWHLNMLIPTKMNNIIWNTFSSKLPSIRKTHDYRVVGVTLNPKIVNPNGERDWWACTYLFLIFLREMLGFLILKILVVKIVQTIWDNCKWYYTLLWLWVNFSHPIYHGMHHKYQPVSNFSSELVKNALDEVPQDMK